MHVYEVRPHKDKRGVDLICDGLPFGGLWYAGPNARPNAISYAKFYKVLLVRHAAPHVEIAFATIKGNEAGAEPAAYPRSSAR
jgi:hypothetical protein